MKNNKRKKQNKTKQNEPVNKYGIILYTKNTQSHKYFALVYLGCIKLYFYFKDNIVIKYYLIYKSYFLFNKNI